MRLVNHRGGDLRLNHFGFRGFGAGDFGGGGASAIHGLLHLRHFLRHFVDLLELDAQDRQFGGGVSAPRGQVVKVGVKGRQCSPQEFRGCRPLGVLAVLVVTGFCLLCLLLVFALDFFLAFAVLSLVAFVNDNHFDVVAQGVLGGEPVAANGQEPCVLVEGSVYQRVLHPLDGDRFVAAHDDRVHANAEAFVGAVLALRPLCVVGDLCPQEAACFVPGDGFGGASGDRAVHGADCAPLHVVFAGLDHAFAGQVDTVPDHGVDVAVALDHAGRGVNALNGHKHPLRFHCFSSSH